MRRPSEESYRAAIGEFKFIGDAADDVTDSGVATGADPLRPVLAGDE